MGIEPTTDKFLAERDRKLQEQGKRPGASWRETWTAQHQRHSNALAEANKTRERVRREAEQAVGRPASATTRWNSERG
ncbi:hypothetical protein [Schaalia hyovaginalis]|uniref:hypothetical protein n=1 Tax=Schaalia hyovaginalis TaxID=29316 RepID=UPI0012B331DA|nr:hypothetical protein [Schaalia hyovaginalis]MST63952.1 hypothetical protein [Schaalia hyovaginalis]